MQVQINIRDRIWNDFVKLGLEKLDIDKITEEALKKHIKKAKTYKKLLALEGKITWEGNLDEMRSSRI